MILAAGSGRRLGALAAGRPKGLLEVNGETLVERALRLLGERGIERVVLVAGYRAERFHDLAEEYAALEVVENPEFEKTDSMASLACALPRVDGDFLLLESDLLYEARALDALLTEPGPDAADTPDAVLASGPTGAGDEVWIEAPGGRIRRLSKDRAELAEVTGELVGISRISRPLAGRLRGLYREFQSRHGHGRMSYDTHALDGAVREHPVQLRVVPDLVWGEIDDAQHWERIQRLVAPALLRRERGAAPASEESAA